MIRLTSKGSFNNLERFLKKANNFQIGRILDKYGNQGVAALSAYTPKRTGKTANSWDYGVEIGHGTSKIWWYNNNYNEGVNIAVIIQYGHGTGYGGYVAGRDYINPAIAPIFDQIADAAWREVTNA